MGAVFCFFAGCGVVEFPDDPVGVTTYRGIVITRHPPMLFRNKGGKNMSLVTCSFSLSGFVIMAESIAKARQLIDEALGPKP
jgi:hypothetical protein